MPRTAYRHALSLAVALAVVPQLTFAATPEECRKISPNLRPATSEDAVVKNGTLKEGDCYNPSEIGINAEAEEARRYLLETRNSCSNGDGITGEDGKNCILRLDGQFAISLMKMFKENPDIFSDIKILSGYRTSEGEVKVSGKDTGNHRRGCAVDLAGANSSNKSCLKACDFIVKNSSKLKLAVPYFYSPEYNHVEPVGACGGGAGAPANAPGTQPPYTPPSSAPTSNLTNAIRQAIAQPPPMQNIAMPQPFTQAQPVVNAFQEPVIATMPTQIDVKTETSPTGPSVADKLEQIIKNQQTGTSSGSTTPIVVNKNDVARITEQPKETPVPDSKGVGASIAQNTFSTDDLSSGATNNFAGEEDLTGFARILAAIRDTLLKMLAMLVPFRTKVLEERFIENQG